jgi:DNA recombination protein RmuC
MDQVLIFLFFSLFLFFFYKYIITSKELSFLRAESEEQKSLIQKRISDAELISKLKMHIEFLEKEYASYKKSQDEAFAAAKSSLFSLGTDLSNQLIELHKKENLESRKLSEEKSDQASEKFNKEFERIVEFVSKLDSKIQESKDTMEIVKQSLLSPSGAGALAEITLENILKASGLRAELDYHMQYQIMGADSERLRPDALIFLPGNNVMIVDAKASKFLLEGDSDALEKSMLIHLRDLASRDYQNNILGHFQKKGIKYSNVVTLMFLPSEHAIEKISDLANQDFMQKAWNLGIYPVGPAGLVNMLSLAKFQITDHLRNENYKLILEEVRKLINSISVISEYSRKMGGNLQNMVSNYDKFAASFNRNFLAKAKNLSNLGLESIKIKNIEQASLERYQLIASKGEVIEIEHKEEEEV